MAKSKRVLFVAGAVSPFTEQSSISSLVRSLAEQLQDTGDFEARIMMPCYGNIDERKHNLHEVIRLSGTDVPMGSETETVTVKVASVPGTQLQVYFMDQDGYFDRNGDTIDSNGTAFEDNARRALFFNRAVLETILKLRWGPDLIHGFGWISGFVPLLLSTTYENEELLNTTKAAFTPDDKGAHTSISSPFAEQMELSLDGHESDTLSEIGVHYADNSILPPDGIPVEGASTFSEEADVQSDELVSLYDQMLSEVPA